MTYQILSLVVLTLTLVAVVWYTIVTRRMQQAVVSQVSELVRQRRLSNMPAFVAGIQHRGGADYLELTNIGKGIAINVAIENVVIRYPTHSGTHAERGKPVVLPMARLLSKTEVELKGKRAARRTEGTAGMGVWKKRRPFCNQADRG